VDENVVRLEALMGSKPDRFILEGGAPAAAALFLANEVTRRAERLFISLPNTLSEQYVSLEPKARACQQYLNHLSYQLYLMARVVNRSLGVSEESISTDPTTGQVTVDSGAE
jgi:cob(I)alamin adenosyltransferase